jgi:DNA-binding transcriptional regulator YiaG
MTAKQIRSLRKRLGLTQQGLALRLGLTARSTVCHFEAGRKAPVGPTLELLKLLDEQTRHRRRAE